MLEPQRQPSGTSKLKGYLAGLGPREAEDRTVSRENVHENVVGGSQFNAC